MHSTRLMRARINERLERASRYPVTLIVAPAGFGKSVALRDFLQTSRMDVLRYDVRREDGNLLSFVRGLSEALEPAAPGAIGSFPAVQQRVLAADEPVRQLSDWFAEHLKNRSVTIVIDDLHYAATDAASIALVADLIERTSDRIKWIIAARSDVGLPIATWIAYGRMDIPIGEDDLRFTTEEALATASPQDAHIEAHEVEALRQLTDGWPVALTIALRTRTHAADLRSASSGTRELVYRYLAEQVLSALPQEQRAFVFATCVFSSFDADIAKQINASSGFLQEVRSKVAFLQETSSGEYRYHELFRDFLETELRRSGDREFESALTKGAALLEQRGNDAEALELYSRAHACEDAIRIIARSGFSLFEQGHGPLLQRAISTIPDAQRAQNAMLLALQAMIDASLGRIALAERGFLAAIDAAASTDLRMRLVHRYTIELVRQERNCIDFLEPYATDASIPPHLRVPLLGTLATNYLQNNRSADAVRAIDEAIRLIDPSLGSEATARVFQQIAWVQRYAGSIEQAEQYAQMSIELAIKSNMYEIAARAYSVLYTIQHDERDDAMASLAILEKIGEYARKGASSRARLFALIAEYDIAVDRGDDAALGRLDREIQEQQAGARLISTALLPARAMRLAWSRDFAAAHELLSESTGELRTPEQRALRYSEIALYATAAGKTESRDRALASAAEALEDSDRKRRRVIRARLLIALAEITRGHASAAHRQIAEAERGAISQTVRQRTLARAVRVFYQTAIGQSEPQDLEAMLERLRDENLGGLTKLIAALPTAASAEKSAVASLTEAEREVLRLLVSGASSKQLAAATGRSPHTIDTHIRAICRKLGCAGRREAVALATSQGWVQT